MEGIHGSWAQRQNFAIQGGGIEIHWADLDEDISIEGIIAGRPSKESAKSLKRWLSLKNGAE